MGENVSHEKMANKDFGSTNGDIKKKRHLARSHSGHSGTNAYRGRDRPKEARNTIMEQGKNRIRAKTFNVREKTGGRGEPE